MNQSTINQILLVGHPHCGEDYLASVFAAYDYDVPVNAWGKHGTVNWLLAVDPKDLPKIKPPRPPGGFTRPENVDSKYIIHYIGDPFNALPSIIANDTPECYNYRKRILYEKYRINLTDYDPLNAAAISFILWNKMIEEQKPFVVRIEDPIGPVLKYVGWSFDQSKNLLPPDFKKATVNWLDISSDLLQALDNWCFGYGYKELSKSISGAKQSANVSLAKLLNASDSQVVHGPRNRNPHSQQVVHGPRNRNSHPQQQVHEQVENAPNIRPRLVHNVIVQTQQQADVTSRERMRRPGFSVRGKV